MMTIAICYGVVAAISLAPLGYAFWTYLDNGSGLPAEPETSSVNSVEGEKCVEGVTEQVVREEKV